jgi:hypothetical protein
MSSASSRRSALPAGWTEVLDQIQRGLEQAVAAAAEREQALQADDSPPNGEPLPEPPSARGENLDALVRRAEANVAAVEAVLDAGLDDVRRWQEAAAYLRRRLAERAGRSV